MPDTLSWLKLAISLATSWLLLILVFVIIGPTVDFIRFLTKPIKNFWKTWRAEGDGKHRG